MFSRTSRFSNAYAFLLPVLLLSFATVSPPVSPFSLLWFPFLSVPSESIITREEPRPKQAILWTKYRNLDLIHFLRIQKAAVFTLPLFHAFRFIWF